MAQIPVPRRAALALIASAASLAALGPAAAQTEAAGEAELRAVIESQIRAFLRDDFAAAFDFASPNIQGMFGTPENFGRMVRQGYPMVWRPEGWRFSTLEPEGAGLRQTVVITDAAGRLHVADYDMVRIDGVWRINGVRVRPPVGAGA